MTSNPAERDTALAVPRLPHTPPLDPATIGPTTREAADSGPFLLAGSRARLHAGASGVDDAWCAGMHVLSSLRVADSAAGESDSSHVALARGLHLPAGDVVETLMVPGGASAVVIEWRAAADVFMEISWRGRLPAPADATLRWNQDASGVTAVRGSAQAAWMVTGASQVALDVVVEGNDLLCKSRLTIGAGDCCRLVCVAVPDVESLSAELAPLREPQSLALARVGEQRRRLRTELVIETGSTTFDDTFLRAVQRVDTHARAFAQAPLAPADEEAAMWTALARAATGNPAPALELMTELGTRMTARSGAAMERAVYLVLVTEYCAWTGSAGAARRAWPVVLQTIDAVTTDIEEAADARAAVLVAAALERLPHVAELLGDEGAGRRAQALMPGARQAAIAAAQRTGGDTAALAIALRLVQVDAGAAPARDYADSALTAWAELVAARAAGQARLERVLGGGRNARAASGDAMESAHGVLAVTGGLLGIEPDAPSGRLTLRPGFPAAWRKVRIGSIRLGDWILELSYSDDAGSQLFELTPVEGGTPLTVIFEPLLPGRTLRAVEVDGTAATLDTAVIGDRIRASVQIVLDHPRTIRFASE